MAEAAFDVTQLKISLEKVRQSLDAKAKRKAVRAGAQIIGAAMIERTPVLIEKRAGSNALAPGTVKASIKIRTKTSRSGSEYALVGPAGAPSKVAHLVEYGHRTVTGGSSRLDARGRLVGGGKVHAKDVPAYPFLRPAFEASAKSALDAVKISLGEEFKAAVK